MKYPYSIFGFPPLSNYSHIYDIFAHGEMTPLRAAPACDGNTNANLINISSQRLVVLSGEFYFFPLQVRQSSEVFQARTLGLAVAPQVALACMGDSPQC